MNCIAKKGLELSFQSLKEFLGYTPVLIIARLNVYIKSFTFIKIWILIFSGGNNISSHNGSIISDGDHI